MRRMFFDGFNHPPRFEPTPPPAPPPRAPREKLLSRLILLLMFLLLVLPVSAGGFEDLVRYLER